MFFVTVVPIYVLLIQIKKLFGWSINDVFIHLKYAESVILYDLSAVFPTCQLSSFCLLSPGNSDFAQIGSHERLRKCTQNNDLWGEDSKEHSVCPKFLAYTSLPIIQLNLCDKKLPTDENSRINRAQDISPCCQLVYFCQLAQMD